MEWVGRPRGCHGYSLCISVTFFETYIPTVESADETFHNISVVKNMKSSFPFFFFSSKMFMHQRRELSQRQHQMLKKTWKGCGCERKQPRSVRSADTRCLEDKYLLQLQAQSRSKTKDLNVRSPKTKPLIPCTFTCVVKHSWRLNWYNAHSC